MSTTTEARDVRDDLYEFLREECKDDLADLAQHLGPERRSFRLPWVRLYRTTPDLAEAFLRNAREYQNHFDEAVEQALQDLPIDVDPGAYGPLHCRVVDLDPSATYGPGELRARNVGDYVEVEGQVKKVSQIVPTPTDAAFECARCGTLTYVPQTGDGLQAPHECRGCERQGPFNLNKEQTEWEDTQLLRIQEPPEETKGGDGATIDAELSDDAVVGLEDGRLKPGNRVRIAGIYTVGQEDPPEPYLDAQAVTVEESDFEEIEITPDDKEAIQAIASGEVGDPFDVLVETAYPKHHGDRAIKEALTLQMFRGVRAKRPDGSWTRGDSHILLLGDPGVGKSALLRRTAEIAPRSQYASGKGASAAGLTAAAVPSDFGDEKWDLQAGVLVLSSGGIACIDEIDKVSEDAVSSMHDALEAPQVVEEDKADIHATLPARTALLAAGNPEYGRFDEYEPIADQITIGPTLLSRFDLLFVMTDRPDEAEDQALASTVLDHRQESRVPDTVESDANHDLPIAPDLLRKYIAYARQHVYPTITEDAKDAIATLYLSLREPAYDPDNPIPVTPRKIQAIARLAEASARVRLSETVEEEDVARAGRLMQTSLQQLGINEEGDFDADIIETGMSTPQRDTVKTLKALIEDLEGQHEDGAPLDELKEKAEVAGIDPDRVEHEVSKLKAKGKVYEPQTDYLRLSS